MSLFLQRTFDSLANGSAYAALAVAISMVFRSTGILNLAQGQLAMFSTYIALVLATGPSPYMKFSSNTDLVGAAWPVWAAILGAIAISMVIGAFTERVIIRPISADPVAAVGATLGVYLLLGAFVRKQWGGRTMFLGSPSMFFRDAVQNVFRLHCIFTNSPAQVVSLPGQLERSRLGWYPRRTSSSGAMGGMAAGVAAIGSGVPEE